MTLKELAQLRDESPDVYEFYVAAFSEQNRKINRANRGR